MAELEYIRWIREHTKKHPRVIVPIGDDCAAVSWPDQKPLLVTTDMLLEGSCFLRDAGPERIGRKAMSVNLSDMAAMAGKPVAAVISLGLPSDIDQNWAQKLFSSMQTQAEHFNTVIVGGDTNAWKGLIAINVTLFGEPTGKRPVTRSGAKPGDALMVTGALGGSILGHHLDFTPLVKEAQLLHSLCDLHAMIDISDGLSSDLHHLCEESGCGAEVLAEKIPLKEASHQMQDDLSPLQHALGDGEDFELLFAVSEEEGSKLIQEQPLMHLGVNLSRIGCFTTEKTVVLRENGVSQPLLPLGYVHRFAS